jgi:hypothetical protein
MLGGLLGALPYLSLLQQGMQQGLQQGPQGAAAAAGAAMLSQQPALAQMMQSMLPGPLGPLLQQQLRPAGSVPGDMQQVLLAMAAAAGAAGSAGGQQQQQQQLAAIMAAAAAAATKQPGSMLDPAAAAAEPRGSGDGAAGVQQQQLSGILPLFGAGVPSSAAADVQQQQQVGAAADMVPGSDAYAALAGLWRSAGAAANTASNDAQQHREQRQPGTADVTAVQAGPAAGVEGTAAQQQQQQLEQGNALLAASLSQHFSSDATATVETAATGAFKGADEDIKQQQQQRGLANGNIKQEASGPANAQKQQQQQHPGQHHVDADDDEVEALMALGQLGQDYSGQQQQQHVLQQQWSQGGGNGSKKPVRKSGRGGDGDQVRMGLQRQQRGALHV